MRRARASTLRFDILMTVLLGLTFGGFFSDLWAHSHGRVETFFTIWHLALYSAVGAVFLTLAITWARGRRAGSTARAALPDGYGLSFVGAIIFLIGGGLDFLWHLAFGIEANVSALFSPTHIVLFAAGLLMTTGPLRAAWRRGDGESTRWIQRLPMVVSVALLLSIFTAMTQFISPIVDPFAEPPTGPTLVFSELYTMNADGSRQTRLLAMDHVHHFGPVWSPDGTRIAFASGSDSGYGVAIANADGSGSRRIIGTATRNSFPGSWSPDGSRVVISAETGEGVYRIESVDVNGGGRMPLSTGAYNESHPMLSPDGARILFASNHDGHFQLYVMNADGAAITQLTHSVGDSWGASWSPDGRRIAFNSDRTGGHEIYVMNGDGTDQQRLTHVSVGANWQPAWSPDGRRIAFSSDRDGQQEIYAINADGSGESDLTRTPGLQESSPSWSRNGVIVYQARANLPFDVVPDVREKLGLASILVQSALLAGVLLFALRRSGLPFGALTIIFGINTAFMSVLKDEYRLIPGALAAGIASDLLVWRLRPSPTRPWRLRVVAFVVPSAYFAAYLVTLALGRGISWPIHLWTGSVVLAGCVGLILALAFDEAPWMKAMSPQRDRAPSSPGPVSPRSSGRDRHTLLARAEDDGSDRHGQ